MTTFAPPLSPLARLWHDGDIVPKHPRVRFSSVDTVPVVIHRRSRELTANGPADDETQRLRFLANNAPQSHVLDVEEEFYLCRYVDGTCFDEVTLTPHLIELIAEEFIQLWRLETASTPIPKASRERPIVEPLGFQHLAATPLKALNIGHQYRELVQTAQSLVRRTSTPQRFVHGDLKLDNLIKSENNEISLIDWECSGIGCPEEDMGNFLASVIFYALARSTWAAMTRPNLTTEEGNPSAEAHFQHEVTTAMRETQELSARFLSVLNSCGMSVDKPALSGAVFLSLMCRLQGAIIAGSPPTTVAVVETSLSTIATSGLPTFGAWLEGQQT